MSENTDKNASREALEGVRKDATDPTLSVGDIVFCGGFYAAVTEMKEHAPGTHPRSPIRNDWTGVQIVTDMGASRWFGREAEAPAPQSGYTPCACRDCMDTTVSSDWTKPELCAECEEDGCAPFSTDDGGLFPRTLPSAFNCQRDDAYEDA